jgi:hypothetical protein
MRAAGSSGGAICYGGSMDPKLRSRLMVLTSIVLIVGALAVGVAVQPGTPLRTRWELSRVRSVMQTKVVFLAPGADLRTAADGGWRTTVYRPVEPVWRYEVLGMTLLPGCVIAMPSGKNLLVGASAESTMAVAFEKAATAAMTVDAAVVDEGRGLLCRRVVVGKPPYEPIEDTLRAGARSAGTPTVGATKVSGRAAFERHGADEFLVLTIPVKQAEASFSGIERQYAVLQPDTLYIAREESGIRPVTLAETKRILAENPTEPVEVDLEQRGQGVFVVQLRVRAE